MLLCFKLDTRRGFVQILSLTAEKKVRVCLFKKSYVKLTVTYVLGTASEYSHVIGPSVFRLTCALQASHLAVHNSSRISAERQKRRCPTQTRTNTAAMAAAADTVKPKTSPKSIKFLFGGLAGYVCVRARSGALCCMGLNWMSSGWEIVDQGYPPLSAARAIDQDQHKDFMWCVMSFFMSSVCEFCCECVCRPRESLVTLNFSLNVTRRHVSLRNLRCTSFFCTLFVANDNYFVPLFKGLLNLDLNFY